MRENLEISRSHQGGNFNPTAVEGLLGVLENSKDDSIRVNGYEFSLNIFLDFLEKVKKIFSDYNSGDQFAKDLVKILYYLGNCYQPEDNLFLAKKEDLLKKVDELGFFIEGLEINPFVSQLIFIFIKEDGDDRFSLDLSAVNNIKVPLS